MAEWSRTLAQDASPQGSVGSNPTTAAVKGVDLRSIGRQAAWVQTPQLAVSRLTFLRRWSQEPKIIGSSPASVTWLSCRDVWQEAFFCPRQNGKPTYTCQRKPLRSSLNLIRGAYHMCISHVFLVYGQRRVVQGLALRCQPREVERPI